MSEIKRSSPLGPVCPYCGYEHEKFNTYDLTRSGSEEDLDCDECGKEFVFTCETETTHTFYSEPKELGEGA